MSPPAPPATLPAAVAILAALLLAAGPLPVEAQNGSDRPLRVFLECSPCDFDFVRTELVLVDWMRDRADADLHVLARSQATGGGGRAHTLDFIGLDRHSGKADTLSYFQGADDTQDTTRRGLLQVLKVGLVRYLADTPAAAQLDIRMPAPPAAAPGATTAAAAPTHDPWRAWVFSVGGNGFMNGESSRSQANFGTNVRAERITATWKFNFTANGSYGRQRFTYGLPADRGDTTVVAISRSYNGNALLVRSVNGHASVGTRITLGMSTFGNTSYALNVSPAFEYNLFPYDESTRRQLLVRYGPGVQAQEYREETIYFRTEEIRLVHSLTTYYSTRQTWGNLNFGVNGQQYLHNRALYNVVVSGNMSVNIARGLSVNFGGNYGLIRDQISLARRQLSEAEVLLRQQQLATDYRYFTNFGLSYRFGSAVQNVVNPRFSSGGGGGVIVSM
jgi:hypothetical protein